MTSGMMEINGLLTLYLSKTCFHKKPMPVSIVNFVSRKRKECQRKCLKAYQSTSNRQQEKLPFRKFFSITPADLPPSPSPSLRRISNPGRTIPVSFTNGATAPRTKPASRDKARFTTGLWQGLSADSFGGGTPS